MNQGGQDQARASPPEWTARRVVGLVNEIIGSAVESGASDIHVEPFADSTRVRIRIDGALVNRGPVMNSQRQQLMARIKVLAGLDVAERRRPQDGRISFQSHGRKIDLRVSVVPTRFGEKAVLRILDRDRASRSLDGIGLDPSSCEVVRRHARIPHGLILVTGPTGSGKSTTLYAILSELNNEGVNISTVEDPVEYEVDGINQTQVKPEIGVDFAASLRAFLRQDPDVLMVGEIRDRETAAIATRAALTGHLVLSTLHTNDAPSAVTRLIDMGVEPFLVAATLRLAIAQRLVRKLCNVCSGDRSAPCTSCANGYRGRTAVFELLSVTDALSELISNSAPTSTIRAKAIDDGMTPLKASGTRLVAAGITDDREVLRALL